MCELRDGHGGVTAGGGVTEGLGCPFRQLTYTLALPEPDFHTCHFHRIMGGHWAP